MKSLKVTILLLFCGFLNAQVFPTEEVLKNGENDKRVNFVFVSDGYQANEMSKYATDVDNITTDLFNTSPFLEYNKFFNVYRIEVPSNESGADHPADANDVNEPGNHPMLIVDTHFDCTFDWAGIHRLLVPANNGAVSSVLATNMPSFDQGFVLSNSSFYGGSGGVWATSSTHSQASEVSIHEIGHSFANLRDEYWAGIQFAGEFANMTAETNPDLVKWSEWLGFMGIGIYPYGGSSPQADWNRPHQSCKMRQLGVPFCSVCKERFIDRIYELVDPISDAFPTEKNVEFEEEALSFTADIIYTEPNTMKVEWFLNNSVILQDVAEISITDEMLVEGENQLELRVTDETDLVRLNENGYVFSEFWNISKMGATSVIDNGVFSSLSLSPNPFNNEIIVECNSFEALEFEITDEAGKLVKSGSVKFLGEKALINTSDLSAQAYFIKFMDAKTGSFVSKTIVKTN